MEAPPARMELERQRQVETIFGRALDAGPGRRAAVLDEACDGDDTLRREVESLLAQHDSAGDFIETPAFAAAASASAPNQIAVTANVVIAHYRIVRKIGSGGMGTVYEAEDTRLRRRVALKFLPEEFAEDAQWMKRFRVEARAASALNHPNICTIYEVDEFDGRQFLAMELLEGQTLRDLISGKPLPLRTVLDLGVQIATAIDAAHAKGIVHRDIKPANIFVTNQRQIKILDFGIAKLTAVPQNPDDKTLAHRTQTGMVVGSAGYMSPEQVRGEPVDHRSDIFAFGCVLYEMLTGKQAFERSSMVETMSAILTDEPDEISGTAPSTPLGLQRLVNRCLEKNPSRRFQSSADLAFALQALIESRNESQPSTPAPAIPAPAPKPRSPWLWATAIGLPALLLLADLGWLAIHQHLLGAPKESAAPVEVFDQTTLAQITVSPSLDVFPSLSPDASFVAYSSDQNGAFDIYVKPLAGGREVQLTTDGDNYEPAWSPDGKLIAFYSRKRGGIWLIPPLGGSPRLLTEFGSHPAWSKDSRKIAFQSDPLTDLGTAAFPAMPPSTIWTVSVQGGNPTQVTYPGKPSGGHGSPSWSPDASRIAFSSTMTGLREIWSVAADGNDLQRLTTDGGMDPIYAPDGRFVYFSGGFSTRTFHVQRIPLSPSGAALGQPELAMDTGQVLPRNLTFSADGKSIAYAALSSTSAIGSVEISPATSAALGPPQRLTFDTAFRKSAPLFSPDGKTIAFGGVQIGSDSNVWTMDSAGKNARPVDVYTTNFVLPGWFPDGRRIGVVGRYDNNRRTLNALDLESGKRTPLREVGPPDAAFRLSPDGKQVAFDSTQGGALNTWVEPVAGGPARQITFDKEMMGFPCWSPDGKFLALEGKRGDDTQLFLIPSDGGEPVQLTHDRGLDWAHDFSPDGDKILFAGQRNGVWNIWWVSRRDGTEKQITNFTSLNTYVRYPSWSPHGNQIVYEFAQTTGNIWFLKLK